MESGTTEKINYIADGGTYYIRVTPYIPTTVSYNYVFMLNVISNGTFDTHEPNDTPSGATVFTNAINTSANIDNPFDEDWYQLSVTATKTKDITISNAPSGNYYAVFIYDSSFNPLGSFYANDTVTRTIDFGIGQYYIRILSMTGYFTSTNYNLKVADYVPTIQPIDSISISGLRLESTELNTLPYLFFETGGQIVFDLDCTKISGIPECVVAVVVHGRFDGVPYASPNDWEYMGDFYVSPGSKQYIWNISYMPSHPTGKMRLIFVADSCTMEVSGTIKSMPR